MGVLRLVTLGLAFRCLNELSYYALVWNSTTKSMRSEGMRQTWHALAKASRRGAAPVLVRSLHANRLRRTFRRACS